MYLELLRKEFIERKGKNNSSKLSVILSILFKLFFIGIFITIGCFITLKVDGKISKNSNGNNYPFLIFYLFIVMIFGILYSMETARKVIYTPRDKEVLLPLPVMYSDIIKAKMTYVYITEVLFEIIAATPIMICYGICNIKYGSYYAMVVFYPLLISLFIVGVALLLSIPYQYIFSKIKKNAIAQFIASSIIVIALCFLYKYVLSLFLLALSNNDGSGAFKPEFVLFVQNTSHGFVPVINLMEIGIKRASILSNLAIYLGISLIFLILGIIASSLFYPKFMKNTYNSASRKKQKSGTQIKVEPINKALLKKELILLFRDDTNMFSYTALLIMVPFLSYVVISTINGIFSTDLQYLSLFRPELKNIINISVILIFITLVNSGACQSISREGKNLAIVKSIPVDYSKQLFIKMCVPAALSSLSLIIADIILISTQNLNVFGFFTVLISGILIVVWQNIFLLYADMVDLGPKQTHLSTYYSLYPILLIIILAISHFFITMNTTFPVGWLYLIEILVIVALLSPFFINFRKRFSKAFNEMEVIR